MTEYFHDVARGETPGPHAELGVLVLSYHTPENCPDPDSASEEPNRALTRLTCAERGLRVNDARGCIVCVGRVGPDAYADVCARLEELAISRRMTFCEMATRYGETVAADLAADSSGR